MWFGGAMFASTDQWFSTATIPASPSEPLASIFLSTGLKNHRGSRVLRGRLDYSDQTPDRRRTDQIWCMQLPCRGDPDSSVLGSACSLLPHSHVHRDSRRLQPFVSKLSCFPLVFISSVSSFSLLSSSLCLITHSTWHMLHSPRGNRAWILILFQRVGCRYAKGYNNRN